jgi:hypothetical protein
MESTGDRHRIQVSESTANYLIEARKGHWCERREDVVVAKGKGEMTTFWVNPKTSVTRSQSSYSSDDGIGTSPASRSESYAKAQPAEGNSSNSGLEVVGAPQMHICPKLQRAVDWISEVLLRLLRQIVARRMAMGRKTIGQTHTTRQARIAMQPEPGRIVFDEVEEIIALPKFDARAAKRYVDPETVELPLEVIEQLRSFVSVIALMYQVGRP